MESRRKFDSLYPTASQSTFSKPIQLSPNQTHSDQKSIEPSPLTALSNSYSKKNISSNSTLKHPTDSDTLLIINQANLHKNQTTVPIQYTNSTNSNVTKQLKIINNPEIPTITSNTAMITDTQSSITNAIATLSDIPPSDKSLPTSASDNDIEEEAMNLF